MPLVPYILLAILTVLMSGPRFKSPYDVFRNLLIPLCGVSSLLLWWLQGTSVDLPDVVVWVTLGMLGWWVVSTTFSPYHHVGVQELSVHAGVVLFVMCGFGKVNLDGLSIVMIGVVANCVYAVVQNVFRYEPIKTLQNRVNLMPIGFIGNTSMLGNFLLINFFLSLMLGEVNRWWFFVSMLIGCTIWLTKCRGSYAGLVVGTVYVAATIEWGDVYTFLVLMITFMIMMGAFSYKQWLSEYGKTTATERLRYWRIAWEQIKLRPLIGIGLNCLQCRVPFIQRELNIKTNGKFLSPDNYKIPYPQKCHNDYLQMACDVGLVGLGMYLVLVVMALMSDAHVLLKGALIGSLVTGMFMHNLHITPINVWTWFVLFACLRGEGNYLPSWYVVGAIVVIVLIAYREVINETICGYYFKKAQITKNGDYFFKGLKYAPLNGDCLVHAAGGCQLNKDHGVALDMTMLGINNYDGNIQIWDLYLNAAKSCFTMGAMLVAEHYVKRSLEFNPNFEPAKGYLVMLNSVLMQGCTIKRQLENKDEPKTNGS